MDLRDMDLSHAPWRKSVVSGGNGCVEVAFLGNEVAVRDSKNPSGPILVFTLVEWQAFLVGVHNGEFDPT
jgi:hypothetical protein